MLQTLHIPINVPDDIVEGIIHTLDKKTEGFNDSITGPEHILNQSIRKSKSITIDSNEWFTGMLYYYVDLINKRNFQYDILGYDQDKLQYIKYDAGDYYTWHSDDDTRVLSVQLNPPHSFNPQPPQPTEYVRKLSFSFQLNDDYTGGELQLYRPSLGKNVLNTVVPKRGLLTVFDSRTLHRVRKVKTGTRKSIVGWIVGPRWR